MNISKYQVKQEVELYSPDGKRKYTKEDFVGRGGLSYVFKAFYQDDRGQSHHGLLKEFFPKKFEDRNEDIKKTNTFDVEEIENNIKTIVNSDFFLEEAKQYITPYKMLLELIEEESLGEVSSKEALRTFIPNFSILWSEDNEKGVPYIWTDQMPIITYGQLSERLLSDDSIGIEEMLLVLVSSLAEMTECVEILHNNGFIHEDIKIDNFGFVKRNNKVLKTDVVLFDINSFHLENVQPVFINEEIMQYDEVVPEKRDIIGLGLALSHILKLDSETIKKIGRGGILESEILERARIFETKAHPIDKRVLTSLVHILEKSICDRSSNRYDSCNEMAINLRELEKLLMPEGMKKEYTNGLALEIIDRQEQRKNKMRAVFQNMLYNHPLFSTESKNTNNNKLMPYTVAIIGFGTDSQQFLDVCLETAQSMNGTINVNVFVFPKEYGYVTSYLEDRPEFEKFFCIKGENRKKIYSGDDGYTFEFDAYGHINFIYSSYNAEEIDIENLSGNTGLANANYVFISVKNGNSNKRLAEELGELKKKSKVFITYVLDDDKKKPARSDNLERVFPINPLDSLEKNGKEYNTIIRMAFNTHLVWDNNLNVDFAVKKKEFENEYNMTSSISSVLAIQYRLHNYGIDVLSDPYKAAKRFEKKKWTDDEKRTMAWQEHKRWVTEKVCAGWEQMSVEESCTCGRTSDKSGERPKHVCLLPSDQNSKIRGSMWKRDSLEHLKQLDPLDRMSVMLHRKYNSLSTRLKEGIIIDEMSDRMLETWFLEDSEDGSIYYEWRECVYRLIQGDRNQAPLFKAFDLRLDRAIERIKSKNFVLGQPLENIINQIRRGKIDIILKSLKYVDYKGIDVDLIEKIPFILTYTDGITLVVTAKQEDLICSMDITNPTNMFAYVSAATVIHPKRIIIAYLSGSSLSEKHIETIKTKKKSIEKYLKSKGITLDFDNEEIVLLEKATVSELKVELNKECCNDECMIIHDVAQILNDISIVQINRGVIKSIDYNGSIETDDNVFWLKYIPTDVSIYVNDIWNLLGRSIKNEYTRVPFTDSMMIDLWDIYNANREEWKALCGELAKKDNRKVLLGKIPKGMIIEKYKLPIDCCEAAKGLLNILEEKKAILDYSIGESQEMLEVKVRKRVYNEIYKSEFIMPILCFQSAKALLEYLKTEEVVKEYSLTRLSNESFVTRVSHYVGKDELKSVFSNHDLLRYWNGKQKNEDSFSEYNFYAEPLETNYISKISLDWDSISPIVNSLVEKGFITVKQNENSFKIIYGSYDVKKMLEDKGRFLEMYTYYRLKKSVLFSDVSINSKVRRGDTANENEFDCIVTKGFQTLIVECKAFKETNIEGNIKTWNNHLGIKLDKFGINGKGILVVDSGVQQNNNDLPKNIVMITDPNSIKSIDSKIYQTMKKRMDNPIDYL